jgi:hypothetical protein
MGGNVGEILISLSRTAWLINVAVSVLVVNIAISIWYMVVYGT